MRHLLIMMLLSSCDANSLSFDLGNPFIFKSKNLTIPIEFQQVPTSVLKPFTASLGGGAGGVANTTITITDGTDCPDGRNGYIVDADPTTIHVCPIARTALDRWAYTLAHEFGHVLGAGHVPCSTMGIMSDWGCQGPRLNYVREDVAQICGNGRTSGGVCKVMP